MTIPIVAHSFDPYHGDLNNRHPRLGAPVKRVVERERVVQRLYPVAEGVAPRSVWFTEGWVAPSLTHPALPEQDTRREVHIEDDGWSTYAEAA